MRILKSLIGKLFLFDSHMYVLVQDNNDKFTHTHTHTCTLSLTHTHTHMHSFTHSSLGGCFLVLRVKSATVAAWFLVVLVTITIKTSPDLLQLRRLLLLPLPHPLP